MERYSKITEKQKREIVLLRGSGCVYKQCSFCDYHADSCPNAAENYALNAQVLKSVTGEFGEIEIINSGSVFELDDKTIALIKSVCKEKEISVIHFESHYLYRNEIPKLRRDFSDFTLKLKLGLETFDYDFRENVLKKGIPVSDPGTIAEYFDEANFLFGIKGQTVQSMNRDILMGLEHFERICINIMCPNTTSVQPDRAVIDAFLKYIYPKYKNDVRIDILINNTDFGVGD